MRIFNLAVTFILTAQLTLLGSPYSNNHVYALGERARARERAREVIEEARERAEERSERQEDTEENSTYNDILSVIQSLLGESEQALLLIRIPAEFNSIANDLDVHFANLVNGDLTLREKAGEILDVMDVIRRLREAVRAFKPRLDKVIFIDPETAEVVYEDDEKLLLLMVNLDSNYTIYRDYNRDSYPDDLLLYCDSNELASPLGIDDLVQEIKHGAVNTPEIEVGGVHIPAIGIELCWGFIDTTLITEKLGEEGSFPWPSEKFDGEIEVVYDHRQKHFSKKMKLGLDKKLKIKTNDDNKKIFNLDIENNIFNISSLLYDNDQLNAEFPSLFRFLAGWIIQASDTELKFDFLFDLRAKIREQLCTMLGIPTDSSYQCILYKMLYPEQDPPVEDDLEAWINTWYSLIVELLSSEENIGWYMKESLLRALDLESNASQNDVLDVLIELLVQAISYFTEQGMTDLEPLIPLDPRIIDVIKDKISEIEIGEDGSEIAYKLELIKRNLVDWIDEHNNLDPRFKVSWNLHASERILNNEESKVAVWIRQIEFLQTLLCGKDEELEPFIAILEALSNDVIAELIIRTRLSGMFLAAYILTKSTLGRLLNLLEYLGIDSSFIPVWLINMYESENLHTFIVAVLSILNLDFSEFFSDIGDEVEDNVDESTLAYLRESLSAIIKILVYRNEDEEYEGLLEYIKSKLERCEDIVVNSIANTDGILALDRGRKANAVYIWLSDEVIYVLGELISLLVDIKRWRAEADYVYEGGEMRLYPDEEEIQKRIDIRLGQIIVYLCDVCDIDIDIVKEVHEDGTVTFKSVKEILLEIANEKENWEKIRLGLLPLWKIVTESVVIDGQRSPGNLEMVQRDNELHIRVIPDEPKIEPVEYALVHIDFTTGDLYTPNNKLDVDEPFRIIPLQLQEDESYIGVLGLELEPEQETVGLPVSNGQSIRAIYLDVLDLDLSTISSIDELMSRIAVAPVSFQYRVDSLVVSYTEEKQQSNKGSNKSKNKRRNYRKKKLSKKPKIQSKKLKKQKKKKKGKGARCFKRK